MRSVIRPTVTVPNPRPAVGVLRRPRARVEVGRELPDLERPGQPGGVDRRAVHGRRTRRRVQGADATPLGRQRSSLRRDRGGQEAGSRGPGVADRCSRRPARPRRSGCTTSGRARRPGGSTGRERPRASASLANACASFVPPEAARVKASGPGSLPARSQAPARVGPCPRGRLRPPGPRRARAPARPAAPADPPPGRAGQRAGTVRSRAAARARGGARLARDRAHARAAAAALRRGAGAAGGLAAARDRQERVPPQPRPRHRGGRAAASRALGRRGRQPTPAPRGRRRAGTCRPS